MTTTQSGIPLTLCDTCNCWHPVTRRHCTSCGRPSMFLDGKKRCLKCGKNGE